MANTTNYNWETPDDTDLVKDGAAAIRTLGSSIDTTTKALNPSTTLGDIEYRSSTANTNTRLGIGTTGQILSVVAGVPAWVANDVGDITEVQAGTGISVASGTGPVPVITNTVATAIDAKGDLVAGTGADTFARLAVGANDTVLTADSTTATGLKWAAPAGGASFAGVYLYNTGATQSINNNTATRITFNAERYDVGGYAASGSTITIPSGKAGYYFIQGQFYWNQNATGYRSAIIRKNTTDTIQQWTMYDPSANAYPFVNTSTTAYLAVGDTIELYGTQTSGGALQAWVYDNDGYLFLSYLGA